MNDKVYLIVLNWNGAEDTIECLKSIKTIHYENFEVVLVDNGSVKENLLELKDWCQDNFHNIVYYTKDQAENGDIFNTDIAFQKSISKEKLVFIENEDNLGFAAGNNVALRYVLRIQGTYALLLNNDTEVRPDFLSIMMDKYRINPELGAVIPQIRYFHNKDRIWNCGGHIFWGFRKYYFANENFKKLPQKKEIEVSFATGCVLLFKPKEVGLLTEKFFFGEEDFEFAYRMLKLRKKMVCALDSIVYHKVGQSINRANVKSNKGAIFIYYLNRFINMRDQFRHIYIWKLWRCAYMLYIYCLLFSKFKLLELFIFLRKLQRESDRMVKVEKSDFNYFLKSMNS